MKKFLLLVIAVAFIMPAIVLNAQNLKFGHISMQTVIVQMPEYKRSLDSLQKMNDKYAAQEKQLQTEMQQKYSDLMANQKTMDTLIQQSRYAELQTMQTNLEQFQQMANEKLQKLQGELLNGVVQKLTDVIKQVAKEMDLIYVFDTSNRNPVYTSEKSIDILPMVKEKIHRLQAFL
jgi:outer membrane protein